MSKWQHSIAATACLWVHVKVRDNAHLGGLQLRRQLTDRALLRVQVQRLRLRKGALQNGCQPDRQLRSAKINTIRSSEPSPSS